MKNVSWWRTSFGEDEIQHIAQSLRNERVSQGEVTAEFERKLSDFLEIENVIAVSNGTSAITLALLAMGIKPGDEVIVPNRTWIATAHAAHIIGAKVILVDVEEQRPIIDASKIEEKLSSRTRAMIPVHMNGRSADMKRIKEIAAAHNLEIIEDAAQGIGSRNDDGFLGSQSYIGCFSLSVAKTISTGQGGFAVTNNNDHAKRMRAIRTHGVANVNDVEKWMMPGFNFRFTDIQASIGLEQLRRLPERLEYLKELYSHYEKGLKSSDFQLIPVDIENGEIPVYNEFLVAERADWIKRLANVGIETLLIDIVLPELEEFIEFIKPFYPDLNTAPYFEQSLTDFPNSEQYGLQGVYLPSGPSQKLCSIKYCIDKIKELS